MPPATLLSAIWPDQFRQNQVIAIQCRGPQRQAAHGRAISTTANDKNIYDWANERDSVRKLPDSPAKTESLRKLETGEPGEPRVAERMYIGRDT